jgi:hypothetical protein
MTNWENENLDSYFNEEDLKYFNEMRERVRKEEISKQDKARAKRKNYKKQFPKGLLTLKINI